MIGQDKIIARLEQLLKGAFTHLVSKCVLKSCLSRALVSDDASYSTLHSYAFGQDKLIARLEQLLKGAFTCQVLNCILRLCLSHVLVSDDASYSMLHSDAF